MDGVFKALADPTRRAILRLLDERDMTAGELAAQFDMSAPSVSHHLSTLKAANLVRARRDKQQIVYSLDATVVQEFLALLFDAFSSHRPAEPAKTTVESVRSTP